jgi:hypothetical protein
MGDYMEEDLELAGLSWRRKSDLKSEMFVLLAQ